MAENPTTASAVGASATPPAPATPTSDGGGEWPVLPPESTTAGGVAPTIAEPVPEQSRRPRTARPAWPLHVG
jgi:hypothetical protein